MKSSFAFGLMAVLLFIGWTNASAAAPAGCQPTPKQLTELRAKTDDELIDSWKHLRYNMSAPCTWDQAVEQVRNERIQKQLATLGSEPDEDLQKFVHQCDYTPEYRQEGEEHFLCAAASLEVERRAKANPPAETEESKAYMAMVAEYVAMSPMTFMKASTFEGACGKGPSATHKLDLYTTTGGSNRCAAYAEAKQKRNKK